MQTIERKVSCPRCKKLIVYSTENIYRPFCSERCKLIDLGDWASEAFKIPTKNTNNDDDGEVNLENDNEKSYHHDVHED